MEISQAELITKAIIAAGNNPPLYKPMLLGLTKASLNSDSFISAASFHSQNMLNVNHVSKNKIYMMCGLQMVTNYSRVSNSREDLISVNEGKS